MPYPLLNTIRPIIQQNPIVPLRCKQLRGFDIEKRPCGRRGSGERGPAQALAADERGDAGVEGQDVVCPGYVAEEGRGAAFED